MVVINGVSRECSGWSGGKLDTSICFALFFLGDIKLLVYLLMEQHKGHCQQGEESVEGEYLLHIVQQILLGEVKHLIPSHMLVR